MLSNLIHLLELKEAGGDPSGREGRLPMPMGCGGEHSDCCLCMWTEQKIRVFCLFRAPVGDSIVLLGDFNEYVENNRDTWEERPP